MFKALEMVRTERKKGVQSNYVFINKEGITNKQETSRGTFWKTVIMIMYMR